VQTNLFVAVKYTRVESTMSSNINSEEFIQYHKDGSIWARGQVAGDLPTGYWEWFRKDGKIMRSGYFRDGIQVGKWTTYDKNGNVYKVTDMKDGKKNSKKTVVKRS
jgi:antitoxin component YwqK of YwqJK toxin-antitoxin module